MSDITLVTGLFDIGRGRNDIGLSEYNIRPFQEYLESFKEVLSIDAFMCIYIEPEHEIFVKKNRDPDKTRIILRDLDFFRAGFPFYSDVQRIRNNKYWREQASWLAESPQANLELYNPVVMSKMGMLNDQRILNPFSTEKFIWIDAGLGRTCGEYLSNESWTKKISCVLERFLFICFPYIGGVEVHGFNRDAIAALSGVSYVERVARGGLFGGSREQIEIANKHYYRLLEISLAQGYMGTEESIFSIMSYLYPDIFDRFYINENGLLGPFFEALNQSHVPIVRTNILCPSAPKQDKSHKNIKQQEGAFLLDPVVSVACYILTFNQPGQLLLLIESWLRQPELINDSTVYVIDNSTDHLALKENNEICRRFGFYRILPKKGNIGICGGRQLAAELFENSKHDFMFFFEDDMLLADELSPACPSGFIRWVDNLYGKVIGIMMKEKFDFLKLSFSEFYGKNSDQWAWYNVPSNIRKAFWPSFGDLPEVGLSECIPPVEFTSIATYEGLAYAAGEVFYSNWPQIVSRCGNRKMFLDTKWKHPYEQTWMSHIFQLTRSRLISPAVLLSSPINHHRCFHYKDTDRVES
jgi:hypothetical protein